MGPCPVVELIEATSRIDGRTLIDTMTLAIDAGSILVVTGLDGCGKSALLNLMSTLVRPTAGCLRLFGQDTEAVGESGRRALRLEIGVVFEEGALLDGFTVSENIELPLARHGLSRRELTQRSEQWMTELGLIPFRDLLPQQLSTSLIRRTALARALAAQPRLLICDEVTTGLDLRAVLTFNHLLRRQRDEQGATIVVAVDDLAQIHRLADRVAILHGGQLVFHGDINQLSGHRSENALLQTIFDDEVWTTSFPPSPPP